MGKTKTRKQNYVTKKVRIRFNYTLAFLMVHVYEILAPPNLEIRTLLNEHRTLCYISEFTPRVMKTENKDVNT